MKQTTTIVVPVPKPRNPLVAMARARKAGRHIRAEEHKGKQRKADLWEGRQKP